MTVVRARIEDTGPEPGSFEAAPGPADGTAAHDRRHGRLTARLRPALPAQLQPGAVPLGAVGAGTAATADDRRLRDRGAHHRAARQHHAPRPDPARQLQTLNAPPRVPQPPEGRRTARLNPAARCPMPRHALSKIFNAADGRAAGRTEHPDPDATLSSAGTGR